MIYVSVLLLIVRHWLWFESNSAVNKYEHHKIQIVFTLSWIDKMTQTMQKCLHINNENIKIDIQQLTHDADDMYIFLLCLPESKKEMSHKKNFKTK